MGELELTFGEGRAEVKLMARYPGNEPVIYIHNHNAHVGAVALGEFDSKSQRVSVSVITKLGHKDDTIARAAAYRICKDIKRTVCVVAGVHLDNITQDEIEKILSNAINLVDEFLSKLSLPTG